MKLANPVWSAQKYTNMDDFSSRYLLEKSSLLKERIDKSTKCVNDGGIVGHCGVGLRDDGQLETVTAGHRSGSLEDTLRLLSVALPATKLNKIKKLQAAVRIDGLRTELLVGFRQGESRGGSLVSLSTVFAISPGSV